MKTSRQHFIQRPMLLLLAAVGYIAVSCSEVTYPEENFEVTLSVQTTIQRANTRQPLNDVQVTATLVGSGEVLSGRTGADGSGSLLLRPLNLPRVGGDVAIRAEHPVYGARFDTLRGVCENTSVAYTFDDVEAVGLNCNTLANTAYSFRCTDPVTGSESIRRNSPPVVNLCRPVARNTGIVPLDISIPSNLGAPFRLSGIAIDGTNQPIANPTTVRLLPGQSLTLCFDVVTENTSETQAGGEFSSTLAIGVSCPGQTATLTVQLAARIVEDDCDCENISEVVELTRLVPTGSSEEITYTYSNVSDCPITLSANAPTAVRNDEWTLVEPAALSATGGQFVVEAGSSLTLRFRFSPEDPATGVNDSSVTVFPFTLLAESGQTCNLNLRLRGQSCSDACPILLVRTDESPFFPTAGDVVPFDFQLRGSSQGGRVRLRSSCGTGGVSTAEGRFRFTISELACEAAPITYTVTNITQNGSLTPFSFVPSSIPLSQGDTSIFEVVFVAPTIQEFSNLLASNGGPRPVTGGVADSTFTVRLDLRSGSNCFHSVVISVIVTTLPDISPVRNLRSYNQRTFLQPTAENEVYVFTGSILASLRTPAGAGPFPPDSGDIFVDILPANWDGTNQAAFAPPYPPILYLNNGAAMTPGTGANTLNVGTFDRIKTWSPAAFPAGYPEARFNNPRQLLEDFEDDVRGTPGFFTTGFTAGPVTPAAPSGGFGAVYVLTGGGTSPEGVPCEVALIYIRSINNGTEDNTNRQSAIEFRSAYPVLVTP